jgi:beta-mannanase
VSGSHFLFVWNPNICTENLPLNEWYPGNSYVDIIGADAYDEDCNNLQTVSEEGWAAYANDSSANTPNNSNYPSLNNIEAFAAANGKPFALPEWGESTSESDDPTYVTDMGQMVKDDDTSFQAWFDDGSQGTQMLGPDIPLSTSAYEQEFD